MQLLKGAAMFFSKLLSANEHGLELSRDLLCIIKSHRGCKEVESRPPRNSLHVEVSHMSRVRYLFRTSKFERLRFCSPLSYIDANISFESPKSCPFAHPLRYVILACNILFTLCFSKWVHIFCHHCTVLHCKVK